MANYTPTTAFGPKDALANGDPSKVILGTQVDVEFDNIATAIATKLDTSSGAALSGNNTWTGTNDFTGGLSADGSGAVDVKLRVEIASVDSLWLGSNNSGSTNAVGAQTGSDYLFTNQGRPIVIGTSGVPRVAVTGSGNLTVNAPDSGVSIVATGLPGSPGIQIQSATANTSAPILESVVTSSGNNQVNVICATNANDSDLNILLTQIGATTKSATISPGVNIPIQLGGFSSHGSAGIKGFGPTAAAYVDMTPDKGTFTGTPTGVSSGGPFLCTWYRIGPLVTLVITNPNTICTSNASTFTMTGLPSAIQPASILAQQVPIASSWLNGGASASNAGAQIVANNGTVTFFVAGNQSGWISSSTKGPSGSGNASFVLQYLLL